MCSGRLSTLCTRVEGGKNPPIYASNNSPKIDFRNFSEKRQEEERWGVEKRGGEKRKRREECVVCVVCVGPTAQNP
jgi:hypothetical protein